MADAVNACLSTIDGALANLRSALDLRESQRRERRLSEMLDAEAVKREAAEREAARERVRRAEVEARLRDVVERVEQGPDLLFELVRDVQAIAYGPDCPNCDGKGSPLSRNPGVLRCATCGATWVADKPHVKLTITADTSPVEAALGAADEAIRRAATAAHPCRNVPRWEGSD